MCRWVLTAVFCRYAPFNGFWPVAISHRTIPKLQNNISNSVRTRLKLCCIVQNDLRNVLLIISLVWISCLMLGKGCEMSWLTADGLQGRELNTATPQFRRTTSLLDKIFIVHIYSLSLLYGYYKWNFKEDLYYIIIRFLLLYFKISTSTHFVYMSPIHNKSHLMTWSMWSRSRLNSFMMN